MYSYSLKSSKNLGTCHIDLQTIFYQIIKTFDCTIVQGTRGKKEQNELFKKEKTKVQYPNSKHNKKPSMAVDAVPYPIDWKDTNRMKYFAGHVVGIAAILYHQGKITHLVRWGGDWNKNTELKDNKFQDFPHFELYKPDTQ